MMIKIPDNLKCKTCNGTGEMPEADVKADMDKQFKEVQEGKRLGLWGPSLAVSRVDLDNPEKSACYYMCKDCGGSGIDQDKLRECKHE